MAAHIDGRAASAVDMTGRPEGRRGVQPRQDRRDRDDAHRRARAGRQRPRADRLRPAGRRRTGGARAYAKDRTRPAATPTSSPPPTSSPTARPASYGAAMERRIKAATRAYDGCPRWRWAEHRLGDAIYANMINAGLSLAEGPGPGSPPAPFFFYRAHPPERRRRRGQSAGFRGRPHRRRQPPPSAARRERRRHARDAVVEALGRPPRRRADRLPETRPTPIATRRASPRWRAAEAPLAARV